MQEGGEKEGGREQEKRVNVAILGGGHSGLPRSKSFHNGTLTDRKQGEETYGRLHSNEIYTGIEGEGK